MSHELVEKLILFLKKSIPDSYIPHFIDNKISINIRSNSRHGFVFFIKIAEIEWSSGEFILTFFPNNSVYQDRLPAILANFNPKE